MRRLLDAVSRNNKRLEETIRWLHDQDRRFFSGGSEDHAQRQRARDLALSILEQGAKVRTLATVLKEEIELRRQTRTDARSGPPNEMRVATTGSGLISVSATERDMIRHDDKLVSARTQLLTALEQYNARVRQFANFEGY